MQPADDDAPLYKRLLGDAWDRLPEALRVMHEPPDEGLAEGIATVERGTGVLARLVAAVFRFPAAGSDVPVTVRFEVRDRQETWTRTFGGRSFASRQHLGIGRFERLVCESFGPFTFGMAVVVEGGRLRLVVRRWSAFGIPMPASLAPQGDSYEHADDGRFHFHVEIALPLAGPIVKYRGWLAPRW